MKRKGMCTKWLLIYQILMWNEIIENLNFCVLTYRFQKYKVLILVTVLKEKRKLGDYETVMNCSLSSQYVQNGKPFRKLFLIKLWKNFNCPYVDTAMLITLCVGSSIRMMTLAHRHWKWQWLWTLNYRVVWYDLTTTVCMRFFFPSLCCFSFVYFLFKISVLLWCSLWSLPVRGS